MKATTPTKAELEQRLAEVLATVERAVKRNWKHMKPLNIRLEPPLTPAEDYELTQLHGAWRALSRLSRQLKRKAVSP